MDNSYKVMLRQAGQRLIITWTSKNVFGNRTMTSHFENVQELIDQEKYWDRELISYKVNNGELVII